jgi:formylglycine-generating enzyme required for sulfatase activity
MRSFCFAYCALASTLLAQPHSLEALLSPAGFVRIPAGEFTMGSENGNADERPVRKVKIPKTFWMSKYEVTQAQWEAVLSDPHIQTTGSRSRLTETLNPSHFKGPDHPVESVSWENVQVFLRELNKRDPKHEYRLPTEAEWEYAARAGSKEDVPKDMDGIGWYQLNSGRESHPVGQKRPNAWGLYDIFGNVFEWVSDWYEVPPGSYKIYRGCSWHSEPKYCRAAFRMFDFPSQGQHSIGFRLVRVPKSRGN